MDVVVVVVDHAFSASTDSNGWMRGTNGSISFLVSIDTIRKGLEEEEGDLATCVHARLMT